MVDETDQMIIANDRFTDHRACVANVSDGHQADGSRTDSAHGTLEERAERFLHCVGKPVGERFDQTGRLSQILLGLGARPACDRISLRTANRSGAGTRTMTSP